MPNTTKKLLSALLAAVAATLVSFATQKLVPVAPATLQPILLAVLVGIAHYIDAWQQAAKVAGGALILLGLGLAAHSLTACSSAQLNADLHKVEVCAADPRVDACVVAAAGGTENALACVQLCLAEPNAKTFRLKAAQ